MVAARALLGRAGGQDCLEVFALLVKVKEQRAWCASESGIHLLPCDCSLRAPTWFVESEIHGIRLGLHDDNRNLLLVCKRMDVGFVEKEVLVDGVRYLEGGRAYRQLRHLRGPKVRHAPFCHPCLAPNPPLGLLHACFMS